MPRLALRRQGRGTKAFGDTDKGINAHHGHRAVGWEEVPVPMQSEFCHFKIKCSCHRNINWEQNLKMTLKQKMEHYGEIRTMMKIEQLKGKFFKRSLM